MEETKELKEEQVVDTTQNEISASTPEKIPESSESSESQNVVESANSENTEETVLPETGDHVNAPHISDGDEIAKKEGIDAEIKLDLSEVEFGEDGLPVLTDSDYSRIRLSTLALDGFEQQIEIAKTQYFAAKEALENDDEVEEKRLREEIEEVKKEIESAESEEKKTELNKSIENKMDLIRNLPKNNPEIKREYETHKLNAIKLIATYQYLSRKNILKMQENGSLLSLISSSADAVFLSYYTDLCRISENKGTIDEDEVVKTSKENIKKVETEYNELSVIFSNLETLKNREKVESIDKYIEKESKTEEGKKLVDEVILHLNRVSRPDIYPKDVIAKSNERLRDISLEAMNFENNPEVKDLEDVKNEESDKEKFIDNITSVVRSAVELGFAYSLRKMKTSINSIYSQCSPFPMVFNTKSFKYDEKWEKAIKEVENTYKNRYDELKKIIDENEDKIFDRTTEISDEFKKILTTDSFVNAVMESAIISGSNAKFHCNDIAYTLTLEHAIGNSSVLNDVISVVQATKGINKNNTEDLNIALQSVDAISMIYTNFYNYISMLKDSTKFNANFASIYDPKDEIKKFYFANKEFVDKKYDEFESFLSIFTEKTIFDIALVKKINSFISRINSYITENENEINLLASKDESKAKKKIKDPFEKVIRYTHLSNYINSYSASNEKMKPIFDEISKYMKESKEKSLSNEEISEYVRTNFIPRAKEAMRPMINTLIISSIGISLVNVFNEYLNHFNEKNDNGFVGVDCMKYIFHEFVVSFDAFKNASEDSTLFDYIKDNSKNTSFKGINYEYQKHTNSITEVRRVFTDTVFTSMSNSLASIIMNADAEEKMEAEKQKRREEKKLEKNKKNKNKLTNEQKLEYQKKRKEIKKLKRLENSNNSKFVHEYNSIINDPKFISDTFTFLKNEGRYFVQIFPLKDTRVKVKVLFNKKLDNTLSIAKVIDSNTIEKDKPISVDKAFNNALRIDENKYLNLGEKWYFNQYAEGKLNKNTENITLISDNINNFSISELCRYITNSVLDTEYTNIIKKIEDIITDSGIKFGDKFVSIKPNCKFDIKYFNGTKDSDYIKNMYDNGNLNFFNTKTWFALSFELHFDLINKEKEEVKEETETTEETKKEYKVKKREYKPEIRKSSVISSRTNARVSYKKEEDIKFNERLNRNKNRR